MRVLVNAANIVGGGGVQKAVQFVRSTMARGGEHRFAYLLSRVVTESLQALEDVQELDLSTFEVSPARPVRGGATRKALLAAERRFRPDSVYSVFGPPYVRFRSPHLMGFAIPWVTHPNRHAWRSLRNPVARARHWAWCRYVTFWTRFADQWVLETAVAADGLARVLGIARGRAHVVPNTYGEPYQRMREAGGRPDARMAREQPSDVHLLVFSHWYAHKNLELVPRVAAALRGRDPSRRYRFFLTFDPTSREWARIRRESAMLAVEDRVVNLGRILTGDGPGLYAASNALFMPTLLETFTATYPEAMCMRTPIVTTDLPFARDICGEAALYVPPDDADRAAEAILSISVSPTVRSEILKHAEARLAAMITPQAAYERTLELLEWTARHRSGSAPDSTSGWNPGRMR